MRAILIGFCVAALVAGCASQTAKDQQGTAAIEQRDLFDKQQQEKQQELVRQQDEIRRQQALKEQEDLRKQLEAQKQQSGAQAPPPVVKPLETGAVAEKSLQDPASQLKDAASPLSKRSVYYDFDMYNIKEEYRPLIEAHAKFLMEHKDFKVRIEGNCDERGSREYNLALGQRRADSVKRAMTLIGVAPKQVETVSFGAEKPKVLGSTEEAWAENRRSDLVYPSVDRPQ